MKTNESRTPAAAYDQNAEGKVARVLQLELDFLRAITEPASPV